jgi:HSP20 family molecular chaperone IbpA
MSNELLGDSFQGPTSAFPVARLDLLPNVALVEYVDFYQIIVNLRGVAEDDVTVSVRHHVLTITGDASAESHEDDENAQTGAFRYNVGLPDDANEKDVSCEFGDDDVVLTIGRL